MFTVITRLGFETRNCFHAVQEPKNLTMQKLQLQFMKASCINSQMCSIAVTTEVAGRMFWGQVTLMVPFQLLPFTSSLLLTQVVWGVHTVSAYENFTAQPANHSKTSPLHFFFLTISVSCVILLDIFPSIFWRRLFIFLL